MKTKQTLHLQASVNRPFPNLAWALSPIFLAAAIIAYLSFSARETSIISAYVIFGILGLVWAQFMSDGSRSDRGYCNRIYLFAFGVNAMTVAILAMYFTDLAGEPFIPALGHRTPDDLDYYHDALRLAKQWQDSETSSLMDPLKGYKYAGYSYVIAGVLYVSEMIGDVSAISPRFFNAMVGALVQVLVYRIGVVVYGQRVGQLACVLSLAFTVWNYYAAVLLRDIVVAFGVCLFVYYTLIIRPSLKRQLVPAVSIVLSCAIVYYFRTPVLYILLASVAIFFALRAENMAVKGLMVLVAIGGFAAAWSTGMVDSVWSVLADQADRWGKGRDGLASDSLAIRYVYGAPDILFIPAITIYTALMPVPPIQGYLMHHFFVAIGVICWYFYTPFWVYALVASIKENKPRYLTIITSAIFFGIAYIQPDIRHKTQFLGMGLVQVAYAMLVLRRQRQTIIMSTGFVLMCLGALYLLIKL